MAKLDFFSLSVLTFVSLSLMALALPFAMGRQQLSAGAHHVQRYFLLHASAWVCILLSGRTAASATGHAALPLLLALCATCLVAAAQWQMAQALQHWLGPRPCRRALQACCLLGPVGFAVLSQEMPWRFVWFSTVQGTGLLLLAWMCLSPTTQAERGWRLLLCGCGVVMGLALIGRGAMALWQPEWLPHFNAQNAFNNGFALLAHVSTSLTLVGVLSAWRDESQQRIQQLALTDSLTSLPNRRAFEELAQVLLHRARREHRPIALLVIDIDHFKRINDQYGHAMGDKALVLFAQVLQAQVRSHDLVARWGGEEFCVLVHAQPSAVVPMYQRVRQELLRRSRLELGWPMEFSAGCARPYSASSDLLPLLERADHALYAAKAAGRAQLCFAEEPNNHRPAPPAPPDGGPTHQPPALAPVGMGSAPTAPDYTPALPTEPNAQVMALVAALAQRRVM